MKFGESKGDRSAARPRFFLCVAAILFLAAAPAACRAQSFLGEIPEGLTTIPPTIVSVSHSPESPGLEDPIKISVMVTQPYSALEPENKGEVLEVICHYSIDGGETWDDIYLEEEGKKYEWRGEIDPIEEEAELLYYVEAYDPYGNRALETPPDLKVDGDGLLAEAVESDEDVALVNEGGQEGGMNEDGAVAADAEMVDGEGEEGAQSGVNEDEAEDGEKDDMGKAKSAPSSEKDSPKIRRFGAKLDPALYGSLKKLAEGLSHEGDIESDLPDLYIDGLYFGYNDDFYFLRLVYQGDVQPGSLSPLQTHGYAVAFIPMIPKDKDELLDNIWAWYYAPNVTILTFPPTAMVRKAPGVKAPEMHEEEFDLRVRDNEIWLRIDRELVDPEKSDLFVIGTADLFVTGDFADPIIKPGDATPYSILYLRQHRVTVE